MKVVLEGVSGPVQQKFGKLLERLSRYETAVLAFSGGVDSCFLLAAAKRAGIRTLLAVTVVSPFFTREEKQRAVVIASTVGVEHLCLDVDILDDPRVVRNDVQRCYYCKRLGFSAIRSVAAARGIDPLLHGINTDDLNDYRPGIKAAEELGAAAPLVTAGFSKQEIRECSKALGLATWDLPSQSCLATRIPTGEPIRAETLDRVAQAERLLHDLGLNQVRVRAHGNLARIEVLPADMVKVTSPGHRRQISQGVKALGFSFVSLDLDGYVTGKMNLKRREDPQPKGFSK